MIKRLQGGVEGDDDYPQWFLVDKLNEVIDELNDLEERYAQHTGYPAELMHPKSPPKEEDTPKEAANELEERVRAALHPERNAIKMNLVAEGASWEKVIVPDILSLVESEKLKARIDEVNRISRYVELRHTADGATISAQYLYRQARKRLKELESKEENKAAY